MPDVHLEAWITRIHTNELEERLHANTFVDGERHADPSSSDIVSVHTPVNHHVELTSFYPFGTAPENVLGRSTVPLRIGLGSSTLVSYLLWVQHESAARKISIPPPISDSARSMLSTWGIDSPSKPMPLDEAIERGTTYLIDRFGGFLPYDVHERVS